MQEIEGGYIYLRRGWFTGFVQIKTWNNGGVRVFCRDAALVKNPIKDTIYICPALILEKQGYQGSYSSVKRYVWKKNLHRDHETVLGNVVQ